MNVNATRMIEDEVTWSLIGAARTLIRGKWVLALSTLLGLVLSVLYFLHIPPYYSSTAVFQPPKNTDVSAGPASLALFGSSNDSVDTYLGLLGSRTVRDDVVEHAGLLAEYKTGSRSDAQDILAAYSTFWVDKNSLIYVAVKARTPKLAADIANAYLDALYRLNGSMLESASAHRRGFFEAQLQEQKNALAAAETEFKQMQERTRVVLPAGEAQAGLSAVASLQAQIGGAEARLAGLRIGATEQNPEVVQQRSLLTQLRGQLARQQADSGSRGPAAGLEANSRLPGLTLEYAQKEREVKLRESVYDALVQQYEKARLSAIDPGPQLQVVDMATPPEHKAGPAGRPILLVGIVLGFAAGLLYLLLLRPVQRFFAALREPALMKGR